MSDPTAALHIVRFHRLGGASVENLRLKPREKSLDPPGISVIRAATPEAAVEEMLTAFTSQGTIRGLAATVASATEEEIVRAGFAVMPDRSRRLPNHCRIIHDEGVDGFRDENLERLSAAFETTIGGGT